MSNSFVSASSFALDPRQPAFHRSPCGVRCCDRCSGSGLTANRINQFNASGLYLAFDVMFLFASTSA